MSLNKNNQSLLLTALLMLAPFLQAADMTSLIKSSGVVDSLSGIKLAELLVSGKTKPQSGQQLLNLLNPLVEKGDVQAELLLGKALRDGLAGVTKDAPESFKLLKRAAGPEGKNHEAQFELAKSYFQGIGTDRNLTSSYLWTALSLEGKGGYLAEALKQKEVLSKLLNTEQLKKANELVKQIQNIYLK